MHGHDGGQRAEGRVTVVGAAASVQPVVLDHGLPGAEVVGPAAHLRLLVEVAVQQDGVFGIRAFRTRDVHEDQRGAAFQANHLGRHAGKVLRLAPAENPLHRVVHVTVLGPLGVEMRRLVRNPDVFDEFGDDLVVPFFVDEFLQGGLVHGSVPVAAEGGRIISCCPSRRRAGPAGSGVAGRGNAPCRTCGLRAASLLCWPRFAVPVGAVVARWSGAACANPTRSGPGREIQ